MAVCNGCGSGSVDRFCAVCGLQAGATAGEVSMVGVSGPDVRHSSDRVLTGSSTRTMFLGLAILSLFGLGVFLAVRNPAPEVAESDDTA